MRKKKRKRVGVRERESDRGGERDIEREGVKRGGRGVI